MKSPYAEDLEHLKSLGVPESRLTPLGGLMNGTTKTTELSPVTAELGAMLAHTCRGNLSEARRHGKAALLLGVTRPQVFEALIIGMLHAGFDKFWDHQWILEAGNAASNRMLQLDCSGSAMNPTAKSCCHQSGTSSRATGSST